MPATPSDAKGLLIAAIEDPKPVLYIDDRWLYAQTGDVPRGDVSRTRSAGRDQARRTRRDHRRDLWHGGARRWPLRRRWRMKGSMPK